MENAFATFLLNSGLYDTIDVTEENLSTPFSIRQRTGLERSVMMSDVLSTHSISLFVPAFIFVEEVTGIAAL